MASSWTAYAEVVEARRNDEETFNDCFADLIDDSLERGPGFLNYLLDDTVEFAPGAQIVGTQRNGLPHRKRGENRTLDLAIEDDSQLVGFESKRGDSLSEAKVLDELAKLEYNADKQDVILIAVTDDWQKPEIISKLPDPVCWNSWFHISQRVFDGDGLDDTWNPTISRAQNMFHGFGYQEFDIKASEKLPDSIEKEKQRWDDLFVMEFRPENWTDEWTAQSRACHIFKEGWRLDRNFEPTTQKAPIALQFVHLLGEEDLVGQGLLKFQLKWDGGNKADTYYRDKFAAWFEQELAESDLDLANKGISRSNERGVFTEKTYEFDVDDFPISYYETLKEAFEEHQVLIDFMEKRKEVREIVTETENE